MGLPEDAGRGLAVIDEWSGHDRIPDGPRNLLRLAYAAVVAAVAGEVADGVAWPPERLEEYRNLALARALEAAYNLGAQHGLAEREGGG